MRNPQFSPTASAARLADLFQSLANEYRAIAEISVDGHVGRARELCRDPDFASWGTDEPVSDLRVVAASALHQATGLLGWATGTSGDLRLDGFRALRTDDGRYEADFSKVGGECTGPGGAEFTDHDLILEHLRREGVLP
jgi:hypothetical protein